MTRPWSGSTSPRLKLRQRPSRSVRPWRCAKSHWHLPTSSSLTWPLPALELTKRADVVSPFQWSRTMVFANNMWYKIIEHQIGQIIDKVRVIVALNFCIHSNIVCTGHWKQPTIKPHQLAPGSKIYAANPRSSLLLLPGLYQLVVQKCSEKDGWFTRMLEKPSNNNWYQKILHSTY